MVIGGVTWRFIRLLVQLATGAYVNGAPPNYPLPRSTTLTGRLNKDGACDIA
jgi:hypothetical protein